jgi:prepilin-type N-terminal cleavage/methylation domain-containing protein
LKIDKRNTTGFTLVELLVVIAVLALLAGLALPALLQSSEASNQTKCLSNMRQLSGAYLLMVVDKDGVLVPNSGGGDTWYNAVDDYMPTKLETSEDWRSLCCPSALAGLAKAGINSSTTSSSRATYGLNSEIKIATDGDKPEEVLNRMAKLTKPSATILLGDTDIANTKEWTTTGIQKSNAKAWHRKNAKYSICYFDGHSEVVDQSFMDSKKKTDIFWEGF